MSAALPVLAGTPTRVSGAQKVAAVLMQMETKAAAEVLKRFSEPEAEEVTAEIVRMRRLDPQVAERALDEFAALSRVGRPASRGGHDAALTLLEASFGVARAGDVMSRLTSTLAGRAFDFLDDVEPAQLTDILDGELPQTIALVLAHLRPQVGSAVLGGIDPASRTDVAQAFATLGTAVPEAVGVVAATLKTRVGVVASPRESAEVLGGVQPLVDLINRSDIATERALLEELEERDPALAEEVRSRMLTFDDLVKLDARDMQQVLRGIDSKTLATSMKGAVAELVEAIRSNVSERNRELLDDEARSMGPVRVSQIEEARAEVVRAVRELAAQGVITVARGEEEDYVD